MKIRNGFVSNSSSSSFIIKKDNDIKNVFDLARIMIPKVEYKPQIKEVLERLNTGKDPNTSVRFYSCNYDTYIKNYGNYLLVKTCNNEDDNWYSLREKL